MTQLVNSSWRAGCILFYFLYLVPFSRRRHHFIGSLGEKTPLWANLGERLVEFFFYLCLKLCWLLAGVSFYEPCSTRYTASPRSWRAGRLDHVMSLLWPFYSPLSFLSSKEVLNKNKQQQSSRLGDSLASAIWATWQNQWLEIDMSDVGSSIV